MTAAVFIKYAAIVIVVIIIAYVVLRILRAVQAGSKADLAKPIQSSRGGA